MAKIDRVADLPEWFDIEKYKGCKAFGAIEWYDQLCRRARLFESNAAMTMPFQLSNRSAELDLWRDLTAGEFEGIQLEPLKQRNAEHLSHRDSQPIGMVSIIDLFYQQHRDVIGVREGLCPEEKSTRWGALYESSKYGIGALRAGLNYPIYLEAYPPARPPSAVIRVDLGATDAALRKSFELWLLQARTDLTSEVSRPANPIYSKWERYGLLPYLDLRIWEMACRNKIPDRVMSGALSRNGYEVGESNIRKTLAPLADGLMQDLSALQALAAIEAATLTPANPENFEG